MGDIEWLKASGVRGSEAESACGQKQQRFYDGGEGRDEYLEPFRNEVSTQIAEDSLGFIAKIHSDAGEVERSIFWLARFDAWVAAVAIISTEQEASQGQRGKLYVDTRGNML